MLETIVQAINGVIWSPALVFLCLGSAIFFSVYLKFPQFRFFKHGIKATLNRKDSDAGISPFQSFCTSVGAKARYGKYLPA